MNLGADFFDAVLEQATNQVVEIMTYLMDQLMADGRAFGDHEIEDDGDFVAYYVDLANQGVLEMLPVVNAELATKLNDRFTRIMNAHILSGARG